MTKLKELRLETRFNHDRSIDEEPANLNHNLPICLENLFIQGFNFDFNTLIHLSNLVSIYLISIEIIVIHDLNPLECLKNLKVLRIECSGLTFRGIDMAKDKVKFNSESLEELYLQDFNKISRKQNRDLF